MAVQLSEPRLLLEEHDFQDFDCGEVLLNQWLKKRAIKNQRSKASRTFVVLHGQQVVGYYAIASGSLPHEQAQTSNSNSVDNINNPHDKFFKSVFSKKEAVAEFIEKLLPQELTQHIDLNSLTADNNEYIDDTLKTHCSEEKMRTVSTQAEKQFVSTYDQAILSGMEMGLVQGRKEGKQEGILEGKKEGILNTARNLKQINLDMQSIARVTGLSVEEIAKL